MARQRKIAVVGSRSVGKLTKILVYPVAHLIEISKLKKTVAKSDVELFTGKSSLTVQFVENQFTESYYPTIESSYSRTIRYKGQDYATEIVDTAGQVCNI